MLARSAVEERITSCKGRGVIVRATDGRGRKKESGKRGRSVALRTQEGGGVKDRITVGSRDPNWVGVERDAGKRDWPETHTDLYRKR